MLLLDQLNVLHITQYKKPKGKHCPLKNFNRNVRALPLSTCMRIIFIYSAKYDPDEKYQKELILKLNAFPSEYQNRYEFQKGIDAYQFLLYWIVGGLNQKRPFNDTRILYQLRKCINKLKRSQGINKEKWEEYKSMTGDLLKDGKSILKWLQTLTLEMDQYEKKKQIKDVCSYTAIAREEGLLDIIPGIDYGAFADEKTRNEKIHGQLIKVQTRRQEDCRSIYKKDKSMIRFLFSVAHVEADFEKINSLIKKYTPVLHENGLKPARYTV